MFNWGGYFLIYKNCILSAGWLLERVPFLVRREVQGRAEQWLFASHPFLGPVLVVWILAIPWLICFFPGTVETDAGAQLYMAFDIAELSAHHPVMVTKLMGLFVSVGRKTFGTDSMGIFLYTFCQFGIQSLVVAYAIYVMGRMKAPLWVRWGALSFYSVYPIFTIWGYTMVKDSGYYISVLLFVTTLMHILYENEANLKWRQTSLLLISAVGICCFRKEGCWVVLFTLLTGFMAYRKYRKLFGCVITICLCLVLTDKVYLKIKDIEPGSVREALSVPLQQTARYVKEYYNDITQEELEVLQKLFMVDMAEIAEIYNPELSDPVKEKFIVYPDDNDMKAYFDVWRRQFLRHPDVYIQAFLNQMYGYICPEKKESCEGEDIGVFKIYLNRKVFDVDFGIKSDEGRNLLEEYARLVRQLPILGMLYSSGIYTWILLGCILYLMKKRKWKELTVYIPGCCILLICMLSPVNGCVRYTLPVMALLPIHMSWPWQEAISYHVQAEIP